MEDVLGVEVNVGFENGISLPFLRGKGTFLTGL